MYISDINQTNIDIVKSFLINIESINEIDLNILENGVSIVNDENKICGYITYERFYEYGLIRYFIFHKNLEYELINNLFLELVKKASNNEIESLIAIGDSKEVVNLFYRLNFYEIDFDNFVVNDHLLYGTDFENATILKYNINN